MIPLQLLPAFPDIHVANCDIDAERITITLALTARTALCPGCGQGSTRVHSSYTRHLADLPWAGIAVVVSLRVRKFFCLTRTCTRKIFVARYEAAPAYARRTTRRATTLRQCAFALGGRPAARLTRSLGMPSSRSTLLRLLRATPLPAIESPRVVGVDEWAWRKGVAYGTILVDLEHHRPLALLPDRTVASVAAWLRAHPTIEIVTRDRSSLYAEAIRQGAPHAIQVADRFHLVKNLVEAVEKFFYQKRTLLQAAANPLPTDRASNPRTPDVRPVPATQPPPAGAQAEARSGATQIRERALYQRSHHLRAQGLSVTKIARRIGITRPTVYRYLAMTTPPPRRRLQLPGPRVLDPYRTYLVKRWNEGCRNALQLTREIEAMGYTHSARAVARWLTPLRADSGTVRSFKAVDPMLIYAAREQQHRPFTARQAARLLVTERSQRQPWQQAYLTRLSQADTEIKQVTEQTADFMQLVRQRDGDHLDAWLQAIAPLGIKELVSFAEGLKKDYPAVKAGLTLPWSQGQTEAQVQRLKLLKRQMYGKAGFALLQQRVLRRNG